MQNQFDATPMIISDDEECFASGLKRMSLEKKPSKKRHAAAVGDACVPATHAPFELLFALPYEMVQAIVIYLPARSLQTLWSVSKATREQLASNPWLLELWVPVRPLREWRQALFFATTGTASTDLLLTFLSLSMSDSFISTHITADLDPLTWVAASRGRADSMKVLLDDGRESLEDALRGAAEFAGAGDKMLSMVLADERVGVQYVASMMRDVSARATVQAFARLLAYVYDEPASARTLIILNGHGLLTDLIIVERADLVEMLLSTWPFGQLVDTKIVDTACFRGNTKILRTVLDHGPADPNLPLCAMFEGIDALRVALRCVHADPSLAHSSALTMAAKFGRRDVVKLLLSDDRVRPDDPRCEALWHAADQGRVAVVKMLLAHHRKPTPKMIEAALGHAWRTNIIKALQRALRPVPTPVRRSARTRPFVINSTQ